MNVNLNSNRSIAQPDTPNEHQPMEEPRYNLRQRSAQQLEPGFYTRLNSQGFESQTLPRFQAPSEHMPSASEVRQDSSSRSLNQNSLSEASFGEMAESPFEGLQFARFGAFRDIDSDGNMVMEPEPLDNDPDADSNSIDVHMNPAQRVGDTGFRPAPDQMHQTVIETLGLVPNNVVPTAAETNFMQQITNLSQIAQQANVTQYDELKASTQEIMNEMIEFNASNEVPMNDEIYRQASSALQIIHTFLRTQGREAQRG